MSLEEVIYKRQSHRDYYQNTVDDETLKAINEFILTAKPLYPDIKTSSLIVGNENVTNLGGWKAPHYIAIYSEKKKDIKPMLVLSINKLIYFYKVLD